MFFVQIYRNHSKMAPAYLIVKLQDGDILMMFDMCRDQKLAQHKLMDLMLSNADSDISWWKIIPCDIDDNFDSGYYDSVVFIDWENSNKVRFMGLYREGEAPAGLYYEHMYVSERVHLIT
jgi:hypothetical protein